MLTLRLKQAETALADGQLDEAYELLQPGEVASHRRGRKLTSRLIAALIGRGRSHLDDGRCAQALADCDKAGRIGGNRTEIAELREAAIQALCARRRSSRRRHDILQAAQQQVDDGRLSVGERLLNEVGSNPGDASTLRHDLAARREMAGAALTTAAEAAGRKDWLAAARELLAARGHASSDTRLAELTTQVAQAVSDNVRSAIEEGRLDRAAFWLDQLVSLADHRPETVELKRFLAECGRAYACIADGRHEQAGQILRGLGPILSPKWLEQAAETCRNVTAGVDELHAGPLGLLATTGADGIGEPAGARRPIEQPTPAPARTGEPGDPGDLPDSFVILVDGVGSFLVHRGARVSIGPISSSRRPDVGVMGEAGMPVVTIVRTDEDYFLQADPPVQLNQRAATNELLHHGDRIALAPRCRMKFLRPNAASTSAVIALTGAQLGRKDVRHVAMMDRELVIGPGPSAHIRGPGLDGQVVLYLRDNRLHCRSEAPVMVGGRPVDMVGGIPMDTPVRAGDTSFVITEARGTGL